MRVCSTANFCKRELKHLTETFCNNDYPLAIIKNTTQKLEDRILCNRRDDNASDKWVLLTLPYKGLEDASQIRGLKRSLQQTMTKTNIFTIYKSKRLSTMFNIKDNTHKAHKHNVIYKASYPEPTCNATYIGETAS